MFTLKESSVEGKYEIYLDGEFCQNAYAYGPKGEEKIYEIISRRKFESKKIAQYSLSEIPGFPSLSLEDLFDWISFNHYLTLSENVEKDDSGNYVETEFLDIGFSLFPKLSEWKENYTFTEYQNAFEQIWNSKNIVNAKAVTHNDESPSTEIRFKIIPNTNVPINEFISSYIEIVKQIHKEVLKLVAENSKQFSVKSIFQFPDEIKTFCEQYLLYFVQFLQDLGINASSDLKEEAGKVLFSVTPTDDVEALDKIREALAVYLNLPSSPVLYNDSFQSMQLKQQVANLQHSQTMLEMEMRSAQYALRLAQQNIENQDKIITQQNSFIDNQNKIIEKITSKSIMIDSLENKEELEKFCEGFEVGKSEFLIKHFGLHLNPATVLKNVGKKILGKEEDKSILGLDEETK